MSGPRQEQRPRSSVTRRLGESRWQESEMTHGYRTNAAAQADVHSRHDYRSSRRREYNCGWIKYGDAYTQGRRDARVVNATNAKKRENMAAE